MDSMASQITSLTIVYSAVYSGADKKHQSSESLAFVCGIHRGPVNYDYVNTMASGPLAPCVAKSSAAMPFIGCVHYDVLKCKHFLRYWPFVRGIHRSPVNSPHKGQWRGALMFSLICAKTYGWINNRDAGDLRRHRAHHDVTVMYGWTGRRLPSGQIPTTNFITVSWNHGT